MLPPRKALLPVPSHYLGTPRPCSSEGFAAAHTPHPAPRCVPRQPQARATTVTRAPGRDFYPALRPGSRGPKRARGLGARRAGWGAEARGAAARKKPRAPAPQSRCRPCPRPAARGGARSEDPGRTPHQAPLTPHPGPWYQLSLRPAQALAGWVPCRASAGSSQAHAAGCPPQLDLTGPHLSCQPGRPSGNWGGGLEGAPSRPARPASPRLHRSAPRMAERCPPMTG